jgi:hypothetical protein
MTHPSSHVHEGALGGSSLPSIRAPTTAAERLQALLRPVEEAKV